MAENPNPNPASAHGFGTLNDVSKPQVRKKFGGSSAASMSAMAEAAADFYTPKALANVGQFKAIVLRVKENPPAEEPGGWLSSFFEDSAEKPPPLVEIKARVPEIHSMLPIPKSIGPEGDHQVIDMYPTFIAMTTAVEAPKPGDLVWVDWGNRQNWTDPIYVRPLLETSPPKAGGGGAGGGRDCGRAASGGTYRAGGAPGNSVGGSNVPAKAYEGLPRLKRAPAPKGAHKIIDGNSQSAKAKKNWQERAIKKGKLPPGVTWIGHLSGNGPDDPKVTGVQKRQTIIYFANTTDFSQPWELIYFFHGMGEFSGYSFERQGGKQLAKAVSAGRNFVCVMPQCATSAQTGKGTPRDSATFREDMKDGLGGSFPLFHQQSLKRIASMGGKGKPAFISVFAHSMGGGTLAYTARHGGLSKVGVNRVFLSDCDYGFSTKKEADGVSGKLVSGVAENVWQFYASKNKNVWMDICNSNGSKGSVRRRGEKFMKKYANEIKGRMIYHIPSPKGHGWIGANCINIVPEGLTKKDKEVEKKKAEEAKKEPVNEEKADNASAEDAAKEAKAEQDKKQGADKEPVTKEPGGGVPKKEDKSKSPPAPKPKTAPSENSKKSSTPKKPTWKTVPATPFTSNRVKVKHYGGTIKSRNSPLMEVVNEFPGKGKIRLHKLFAKRFYLLRKAAAAAGFPDVKVSSGWRRHSWKSREHYEQRMIARYGSVKEGRKWVAYNSPHETGLAMDFNCHGVVPSKKRNKAGKQTPFYKWLVANAHKWGITPYKKECWHWELRLPHHAWATGEEFTEDLAVRVTHIGGKNSQMAQGGSGGGGSGGGGGGGRSGGGAPCVSTGGGRGGGGGAPPGPFTPGPAYAVSGGGSLGKKLVGGPSHFGDPNKNMREVKGFVLHETAGHPYNKTVMTKRLARRPPNKGVHFWGSCEGFIIQTAKVEQRLPHANSTNGFTCGIEVCNFGNGNGDYAVKWQERLARGMHVVSHKGKGDIKAEPGKVVPSSVHSGCQVLPTWQQCDSTWKLIVWLSKNPPKVEGEWRYGGKKGTPKIAIPIKFPCVPDKNKFWWSKWNGGPTKDSHSANSWFKKHQPAGIYAHARIHNHHDGLCLEYYCLARAQGLGSKAAYYAMVGALCSGTKGSGGAWTLGPKNYVALGKKKFKAAWFKGRTRYWVGKKKWKELAAANPAWFANPTSAKA